VATVTVDDVLRMPVLRAAAPVVVAGASGLDRAVRWVHSAELADIAPLLREGDLLLSTGIAMPDTTSELAAYAASLAQSGAVGLVIELGRRWQRLPPALVTACDAHDLPLVALETEVRFAAVAQSVGERIVDERLSELREAQRVHDTFTELSIAESGPREILDAVQQLAGAGVVLESEEHQVLDYRAGPAGSPGFLTGWSARSRAVHSVDRTTWSEPQGWLVTRVGRRERGWGRLVVQTSSPPSERLVAVAERAAAALALHRLHDRQRDSALRRTHHELILGLLNEPGAAELWHRCELAGVPIARRQLVGLTIRSPFSDARPGGIEALADEAMAATIRAAAELKVPALVCEVERDVRALLSISTVADATAVVDQLAAKVHARRGVVIAAGRPVQRPGDADRTLREAQHVMQSLRDPRESSTVHRLEDVHLRGLLTMLADDDRVRLFVGRELDPIREHDQAHGTELLATVRALVQHPTSKSEAAASLHLSRPVFYDRLRKVERLVGRSLDDPDVRVSFHVALIADDIRPSS
jgi:PucR family transcriptional regulator, purine catabolism regulatory protein